jgi:hypothetical protein
MMPRYKLRTLLILLAIGPPAISAGWTRYGAWQAERLRAKQLERQRIAENELKGAVTHAEPYIEIAAIIQAELDKANEAGS